MITWLARAQLLYIVPISRWASPLLTNMKQLTFCIDHLRSSKHTPRRSTIFGSNGHGGLVATVPGVARANTPNDDDIWIWRLLATRNESVGQQYIPQQALVLMRIHRYDDPNASAATIQHSRKKAKITSGLDTAAIVTCIPDLNRSDTVA
jgi:hypothetical protein